jgi:hypothetical protein
MADDFKILLEKINIIILHPAKYYFLQFLKEMILRTKVLKMVRKDKLILLAKKSDFL